jgi:hypothetical protein
VATLKVWGADRAPLLGAGARRRADRRFGRRGALLRPRPLSARMRLYEEHARRLAAEAGALASTITLAVP